MAKRSENEIHEDLEELERIMFGASGSQRRKMEKEHSKLLDELEKLY